MANKLKSARVSDAEMVEALENSGGIIQAATDYIGEHFQKTISRATVFERIRKSDAVRAARDEGLEQTKDIAEGKLLEAIRAGNMTAIIFFLKTRAKDRGYTERRGVVAAVEADNRVKVNPFAGMSREELRDLLRDDLPK